MFGEIVSALSIWDRISKLWKSKEKNEPESVAACFVRLFESHGVHRNQIPRFINHGLTLSDVQDDASLLPKLTEEILDAACVMFAVRREWLDGAESQIHPWHDFYKYPERFLKFIDELKTNNPDNQIIGVVIAPNEKTWRATALLVLQETIDYIGEKPIYRYHLCNNWVFPYWKARAYLASCVSIAWKNEIYINGIYKPKAFIDELEYGEVLLGWEGEGIWNLGHKAWDPEYMSLRPDIFLDGMHVEENNYGLISGLRLWLDLEKQGLMDSGFGKSVRATFEAELAKYSDEIR